MEALGDFFLRTTCWYFQWTLELDTGVVSHFPFERMAFLAIHTATLLRVLLELSVMVTVIWGS